MVLKKIKKKSEIEEVPEEGEEGYEGMDEDDLDPEDLEPAKPKGVKKVKRRFEPFVVNARAGIVDSETGEVVAEGEYATLDVLANILERLERMEATIGSLIE